MGIWEIVNVIILAGPLIFTSLYGHRYARASIHVSLVLMVVYAAAIAATLIGRPELRYSITHFA